MLVITHMLTLEEILAEGLHGLFFMCEKRHIWSLHKLDRHLGRTDIRFASFLHKHTEWLTGISRLWTWTLDLETLDLGLSAVH